MVMQEIRTRKISIAQPNLDGKERQYVAEALSRGWLTQGEYVARFEAAMAAYIGTRYAVAVSSGTAALHLALLSLGIGRGDEVILPSLTFIATANAVRYTGATLIFVDVEPLAWGLDPNQIEAAITPRTKAILPVHLYGAPVNARVFEIARLHKLPVIEDACEALGAMQGSQMCGALGDMGCFSFYGSKTITTGEGGMLTTDNPAIAEQAKRLRGQGQIPGQNYQHDRIGYNYRLTDIQAAIGCAQMEHVWNLTGMRHGIAARYRESLGNRVDFQRTYRDGLHGDWMVACAVWGVERDKVRLALAGRGIETRPVFPAVHKMIPHFQGFTLKVTERLAKQGLVLPTHTGLSEEDIQYVCQALTEVLDG
jgi:perosamine synthetase